MSDALSKLLILIEGRDDASPALNKAGSAAKTLGTELTSIGRIAGGVAIGGLGAQLGMGLAQHFKDALTEVQAFGDQVFKLQQRIGISAESASSLLSVFERFGVSSDNADRMLTFFSRGLRGQVDVTEAAMIQGRSFAGTLAELGVQAEDASGKFRPMDQVLAEVQERMSALKGDGETGARAMALFGRSGAEAAPVFNLTRQEFEELRHEAQALGVTLSQDNVDQIRKLSMAHHDMDEAVRGLTIQLGLAFTPALTIAAKEMAEFAKSLNKDGVSGAKALADGVTHLISALKQLNATKPPDWLDGFLHAGETAGKSMPGGKGLLGAAQATRDALQNGLQPPAKTVPKFDLSAINEQYGAYNALVPPDEEADRARAKAMDAAREKAASEKAAAAAEQEKLNREEQLKQLNLAEIAAKRELEIRQHQITVLQRESLDLVKRAAQAELATIPVKQQQADLELQLLKTQDKRAQLEREGAVLRARLSGLPASQALEDNQYQQNLIQAQIRAGVLSGQGIPDGAIDELIRLKFAEPGLQVPALEAGRGVTLAERDQQRGQLETDLATLPLRQSLASSEVQSAQLQRQLDAINAEQRSLQLTKVDGLADLEAKRRAIEDRLFEINQRQSNLAGAAFNITMNVTVEANGGQGGIDWESAGTQLAQITVDAMQRAVVRVEGSAPTTVPGAGFVSAP